MKKLAIAFMLAGLTTTAAFADGDAQTNKQNGPSMQAQPQSGNGMSGSSMSGMGQQQQQQQDNSGSQD